MLSFPLQSRVWFSFPVCQKPLGEMKTEINPRIQSRYKDLPQGKRRQDIWWNQFTCNKMKKSVVIFVVVLVITWQRHQKFLLHSCGILPHWKSGWGGCPILTNGRTKGMKRKTCPPVLRNITDPAEPSTSTWPSWWGWCALGLEKTHEEKGAMGTGETWATKDKEDQRVLRLITLWDAKSLKEKWWLLHGYS